MTPIFQSTQSNCGQACLAMVYSVELPEKASIKAASLMIGRDGKTMPKHIREGLELAGLHTRRRSLRGGRLPPDHRCVVRVDATEKIGRWGGHWIVVHGGEVFDPWFGRSTSLEAFARFLRRRRWRFVSAICWTRAEAAA